MRLRRLATTVAIAGTALAMAAAPALAHVTVNPDEAPKGGFEKLTFRVPNEEPTADTIKVAVQFPADHPIENISVKPHAGGWTADVDTEGGATVITWTGGKIAPGEFDEFEVSVGPLPDDVDSLTFPTVQAYSDGTEVSWIQDTPPGGPEPDRPAPVLTLTASTGGDDHHGDDSSSSSASSSGSSAGVTVATTDDHGESASHSDDGDGLAVTALVVAVVALLLAGLGLFRGRKASSAS